MNKAELIDAIASNAKISKADAGRALDATVESIHKALKKGDRIGPMMCVDRNTARFPGRRVLHVLVAIRKPEKKLRSLLKK